MIQYHIERMHASYPGLTVIEDNNMGAPIRQNCKIPERQIEGFTTTKPSKARIVSALVGALQRQELKWLPEQVPQLDAEMRAYRWDDDNLRQDCVLALAIAFEGAAKPYRAPGRVLGVIRV